MPVSPRDQDACEFLRSADIEVQGRLVDASNATLFCSVADGEREAHCVYKPVSGERPLWDFPDGTLAGREVAAYLISQAAGMNLVPPTVLRPGPFGPGMVQLWVETSEGGEFVDVLAPRDVPDGWRVVLHAHDRFGEPAVLAHADHPSVRLMVTLDVVLNNTDRKGGHLLRGEDDGVYGVDHGICLHSEDKLRTVLWGYLGEPLDEESLGALRRLRTALDGDLEGQLAEHLTQAEVAAVAHRTERLLAVGTFPEPGNSWRAIPWPPF